MSKKTEFYCQCHLRKILKRNPSPAPEGIRGTSKVQPDDEWKVTTTWLPQQ